MNLRLFCLSHLRMSMDEASGRAVVTTRQARASCLSQIPDSTSFMGLRHDVGEVRRSIIH